MWALSTLATKGTSQILKIGSDLRCVYEGAEVRCELCKRRDLPCGDKLLGPKTQDKTYREERLQKRQRRSFLPILPQLPTPDDLRYTVADAQYLQYLQSRDQYHYGPCRSDVYEVDVYASDILIPLQHMLFPVSSKSLRYAILALGSAWKADRLSVETFEYLSQYYKYTNEAIAIFAYADIIYASYALIKLAFRFEEPLDTVLTHFNGVSRCISFFDARPVYLINDDQMCMERIWNDLLADFYLRILRDRRHEDFDTLANYVDAICGFLGPHWPRIAATLRWLGGQREVSIKALEHNIRTVEIYFQYYFLRYLVTANGKGEQEQTTLAAEWLREVCHEMVRLGRSLNLLERFDQILGLDIAEDEVSMELLSPKQVHTVRFEKALLSLYLWAHVVDASVAPENPRNPERAARGAIALCKMYREWAAALTTFEKDSCSYNDNRNLFLAGLILNKNLFPRRNSLRFTILMTSEKSWIKARLEPCIEAAGERYQMHSLEEEEVGLLQAFLDEADECPSMKDVWTISLDGIGVWQCVLGFNWFWGLDMIRRI